MKKLIELQQERQAEINAQEVLFANVEKETRAFTDEETKTFDGHQVKIDALSSEIVRAEKMEANRKIAVSRQAAPVADPTLNDGEKNEAAKIAKRFSITRALSLAKGGKSLDGIEAEISAIALAENERAGVKTDENASVHIPSFIARADAQTVTEDTAGYGGATVVSQAPIAQSGFTPKLFLQELGATRLAGLTGGDIPLPVFNDYDYTWLSETAAITSQKKAIAGPTLSPNRLGAAVPISNRWLMQSSVGDAMIMAKIGKGYDNALQSAAINGAGTGNTPEGILNNAGTLVSAILTAAGDATWSMMVELQGLIEAANASGSSLAYLMDPGLKAALKTITKDAGSGRFLMEGNMVDGINAFSTSLVPELTGQKALIYGDFSQLFIGEWGAISLVVDPYSRLKENSIEVVVNAHADVAIAQPTAFAVNKFING